MFEPTAAQNNFYGVDTGALVDLQHFSTNNRQFRHHPGLPTTKMMLAPEPPGLPPLEAIYMDEQLRFYEQESGKNNIAYCDLQPIGFENGDHMPPSTPQDLLQRQFTFEDIADLEMDKPWQFKPPDQWQSCDVIDWLFHWAAQNRVDLLDVNTLNFNTLTGQDICRMNRNEFCSLDSNYGAGLYETLQFLIAQCRAVTLPDNQELATQQTMLPAEQEVLEDVDWARERCPRWNNVFIEAQGPSPSSGYSGCDSDRESASSSLSTVNERGDMALLYTQHPSVTKALTKPPTNPLCGRKLGRRGRPPKKEGKLRSKQGKGTGKLWEFIRDLLLNPATNPSMIRWERREDGIFKFVQSDKVARLWGDRKQNPRMTYEKLSRAMRWKNITAYHTQTQQISSGVITNGITTRVKYCYLFLADVLFTNLAQMLQVGDLSFTQTRMACNNESSF